MTQSSAGPVRYRVRHQTDYRYSSNVAVCQNQLRMQPISRGSLTCHWSDLEITPPPTSWEQHTDYFGNQVHTFSIEQAHRSLLVCVESEVSVAPCSVSETVSSAAWELITSANSKPQPLLDEYRFASPRIPTASHFADYARISLLPGRGIVDAVFDLTRRIRDEFKYDATATNVDTTTDQALKLKAGVCQDFAHVQIACLRSMGLAARYVSGYLRTVPPEGGERLVGADESHAWLEVFVGSAIGWLGFDPTNGCLAGTDHIPICLGRDYDDVSPMRGVVLGGGKNTLKVSVDVEEVTQSSSPKEQSPTGR
ncbi:MAG: transglutaminase family protein [Planctomycetota bacterium]